MSTRTIRQGRSPAKQLHREHGLDDVSDLLDDLNETRKSESYGDIEAPELDAEDTAMRIESYVEAVRKLLGRAVRMTALAQADRCIRRWPTQRAREWVDGFLRRARKDTNTLAVVGHWFGRAEGCCFRGSGPDCRLRKPSVIPGKGADRGRPSPVRRCRRKCQDRRGKRPPWMGGDVRATNPRSRRHMASHLEALVRACAVAGPGRRRG